MKKTMLTKIKVEKAKRMRKRARRHPPFQVKDPKDLRGAKGALLKNATAVVPEGESPNGETAEQRHPPLRISSDW